MQARAGSDAKLSESATLLLYFTNIFNFYCFFYRDDPSTELMSLYTSVWPTGLSTNPSILDSQVQDLLQAVLTAYLRR